MQKLATNFEQDLKKKKKTTNSKSRILKTKPSIL